MSLRRRTMKPSDNARHHIHEALEDTEAHARNVAAQMVAEPLNFVAATRSGSLKAAERRLDNLTATLLRLIQQARMEFYVNSFELQRPYRDHRVHLEIIEPTQEGAIAARDAMIHGRSLLADLTQAIDKVKHSMKVAINSAARIPMQSHTVLRNWKAMAKDQLQAKVDGLLSDSSHAIYHALAWATIKPELRPSLK
jgi:hypothetical protein